jgi:hypothetical protein
MKRSISVFVVGLVLWVLIASVLNRVLRAWIDGYAAAEPQMTWVRLLWNDGPLSRV